VGTKEEKDSAIVKDLNALDATMLERYRVAMSRGESLRYKCAFFVFESQLDASQCIIPSL